MEQVEELLTTFFPPLPARIEDEGFQQQREPIHMPDLTMEEIERKVFEAKPWKAPGEDGLPAIVWKQLWPVVKNRHMISASGGSITFLDDFLAWVTDPTAEANRSGIEVIINSALNWEERSGATFEGEKTAIVHFTRKVDRSSRAAFTVKEELVELKEYAKILAVVMDSQIRYKQHIARAATRGLKAAMALRRPKALCPQTARQLFTATVTPTINYASNRVLKIGGIAVTGAFRTVVTAVVEAEANILPFKERHTEKTTKLWADICALPGTNPLRELRVTLTRRFFPLQSIAQTLGRDVADRMETINAYAVSPWTDRLQMRDEYDGEKAMGIANSAESILIATSSSSKGDMVGMGDSIKDTQVNSADDVLTSYTTTLSRQTEQNPYTAELEAIAAGLKRIPPWVFNKQVTILSSNRSTLGAIGQQRQQSGQTSSGKGKCGQLTLGPSTYGFCIKTESKNGRSRSTREVFEPEKQSYQAKSTAVRLAIAKQRHKKALPDGVGKYSKTIDLALHRF
ncbi:conserved hypothetical protein [Talaromyces stipitatus ATCC 10500]|uniref:Reverse transcriptase n=1 Tax=Talaromyces stipitatus (strain ATCC 10500 / CBS 375.48 / QM 6759 / NRRL 1006) TaxID=441959 RepID=B8MV99_TALSN|nr:uncharacterized protein TSTA_008510 [Talaromyces stipitatus ATCC 10500]EED11555.1 conserved hypothetical protein [Talaromyces stipitatus ATCC 10500]